MYIVFDPFEVGIPATAEHVYIGTERKEIYHDKVYPE
jgi:hypothetical protein